MRIIDDKTNERIDKVLAILSDDTTLREALIVSFACCGAVCEMVLDQVTYTAEARRAILNYCDMLRRRLQDYNT